MEDDTRHREKGQKDLSHSTGLNERYSTRQRKGRTSVVSFLYTLHNPPPLLLSLLSSSSVFLPRHPGNKTRNSSSSRRCVVLHYSQLICTKPRREPSFSAIRFSFEERERERGGLPCPSNFLLPFPSNASHDRFRENSSVKFSVAEDIIAIEREFNDKDGGRVK